MTKNNILCIFGLIREAFGDSATRITNISHIARSGNKLRGSCHFDTTFAYVISLARNSSIPFLRQKGKSVLFLLLL